MANCSWKFGCTIYWGVVFCSTIFLIALYFQHQYVIPTEAYLYCEKLLKICFSLLIVFAIVAVVFTKSRARSRAILIIILTIASGLFLFTLYTVFLVETVTFPKMKDALEIIRKRYFVDENILGYIQMKHKCCGIQNYTDWRDIILSKHKLQKGRRGDDGNFSRIDLKLPSVVVSCCKSINYCGFRVYRKYGLNTTTVNTTLVNAVPHLSDHIYVNGCYSYLRVHSNNVYEAMRMYSCVAVLFVVSITIVFCYYWWKKTTDHLAPQGWPAPPMDVNSVVYDRARGLIIAHINPFLRSVIQRLQEPSDDSVSVSSSSGPTPRRSRRVTPASSNSSRRPKPVRFKSVS